MQLVVCARRAATLYKESSLNWTAFCRKYYSAKENFVESFCQLGEKLSSFI